MKKWILPIVIVFICGILGTNNLIADDGKDLLGTWKITKYTMEAGGEVTDALAASGMEMDYTFNKGGTIDIKMTVGDESGAATGTWNIDGKILTLVTFDPSGEEIEDDEDEDEGGNTVAGDYTLSGDKLSIVSVNEDYGMKMTMTMEFERK